MIYSILTPLRNKKLVYSIVYANNPSCLTVLFPYLLHGNEMIILKVSPHTTVGWRIDPTTLPPNSPNDLPDTNSISIELVDGVFYLVNQQEDTICLGESEYIDNVLDELRMHLESMKNGVICV